MISKSFTGSPYLFLLFALVAIAGCKASKNMPVDPSKINLKKAERLWVNHQQQILDYESVYLKSKLDIDSPQLTMGVRMIMYMVKDSLIWATVSKLGFETHRLLLKPDTIQLLDKLNRTYYAGSVTKWLAENHIPFNFNDLQRILVGLPPQGDYSKFTITPQNQELVISGKLSILSSEMFIFDLLQSTISNMVFNRKEGNLNIFQSEFKQQSGLNIPFHRTYQAIADEEFIIELEISDLKMNVVKELSFRIPSSYERMGL